MWTSSYFPHGARSSSRCCGATRSRRSERDQLEACITYQDIRRNVAKIQDYLKLGGGLDRVLSEQSMAYDAVRICFLEISAAAVKLGALAEVHEPNIPWNAIRGFGNHLRHTYDEMDLNAVERAVADLDRLDAACAKAIERLAAPVPPHSTG
ncbi:MAG: HepT-like ribonuclease domain-containing protein [Steroidobacteraceae bacterium]